MAAYDRRAIARSLLLAGACGFATLLLALLLPTDGPAPFDDRLTSLVTSLAVPVAAWELLTMLGGDVLVVVDAVILVVLLVRRDMALAILCAATLLAVAVGVDYIKDVLDRTRPPDPLVFAYGGSLPSGHAFLSTVSYGLLAQWCGEVMRRVWRAWPSS